MRRIPRFVLIGSSVYVLAGKAIPGTEDRGKPIQFQPGLISPRLSEDDTWIGNGATVMANVGLQYVIAQLLSFDFPTGPLSAMSILAV